MSQKSWNLASQDGLRVRTGLERETHDSQDGSQGQRAPLTSYFRDELTVLQRNGATGVSLSCTEYENLGGFPLSRQEVGAVFAEGPHFPLLVESRLQPKEIRAARCPLYLPAAACPFGSPSDCTHLTSR